MLWSVSIFIITQSISIADYCHDSISLQGKGPLLAALREAKNREGSREDGDEIKEQPAGKSSAASTLAAMTASVEGALRNLLTCLGVPLLCADPGQQVEVTHLTGFALK